jgi:hypothetical protein
MPAYFRQAYHGRCEPHIRLHGKTKIRSQTSEALQNPYGCPDVFMRRQIIALINTEIKFAKAGKPASIIHQTQRILRRILLIKNYMMPRWLV